MYGTVTRCGATFQTLPLTTGVPRCGPTTPAGHRYPTGLGSSPFARHYWGNHCYFLFLEVLRCFSSLRSPHCYSSDNYPSGNWVVPFGNPRVKGHLHLTAAYRSLSRPSSPPGAKASTRRPNSLSPTLTPYSTYSGDAHTFSCFLRFVLFLDLNKVFTYSLVCQYVKDLFPNGR